MLGAFQAQVGDEDEERHDAVAQSAAPWTRRVLRGQVAVTSGATMVGMWARAISALGSAQKRCQLSTDQPCAMATSSHP